MTKKVIFTSDLHGRKKFYEEFFQAAQDCDIAILGGDLLPGTWGLDEAVAFQREFISDFLLPKLTDFKAKNCKPEFFLMMGNDDWKTNMDLLESADGKLLRLLHNRIYPLGGGITLCGYGYVDITPFGMKDWEKWDLPIATDKMISLEGYISKNGVTRRFSFTKNRVDNLAADLKKLAAKTNPRVTIYVTHAPPHDTALDVTYFDEHVGSVAAREFIDKYQPLATLHGHIHESPVRTGKWFQMLGDTISINPGQISERLYYVTFSLPNIKKSLRHSVYMRET